MTTARILKSLSGSLTVEAALVIPVILLGLAMLVSSFMFMYHKVLLQKTASAIASQAVHVWKEDCSLYYRVTEAALKETRYSVTIEKEEDLAERQKKAFREIGASNNAGSLDNKLKQLETAIYGELARRIKKPERTEIGITFENYLLTRRVTVEIKQEMKFPLGGIKYLLDGKKTLTVEGSAIAAICEPAEYVRNVDFIRECFHKLEEMGITDMASFSGRVGLDP